MRNCVKYTLLGLFLLLPVQVRAQFSAPDLSVTFRNPDQAVTAGLYRIHLAGGVISLDKNTSGAGNFNSSSSLMSWSGGTIGLPGLAGSGVRCLQTDNSGAVSVAASPCFNTGIGTGIVVSTSGTLGVISVVSLASGGTNAALIPSNGGIVYSNASSLAILGGTGSANRVLLSGANTTPAWSAATYPSASGSNNNALISDGTNWASAPLVLASAMFANQGTTSTVLHGNVGGNPSFGAVVEGELSLTDITTNNATAGRHGFLPKLSGSGSDCLLGTGTFGSCAGATAGVSSITGTANQVIASAPSGAVTLSTPQNIHTGANFQVASIGLNVAASANAGSITSTLGANNITGVLVKRNTDTSPTGNFIQFQNAAAGTLFNVDITGTVTAGVWTGTAIANANLANSAVTVTAGTGLSGGGSVSLGGSTTLSLASPVSMTNGGSNASLTANTGGIVYSGASALAILAGTATAGQIIRSGATAAPTWSTATYPATAGTNGNCLVSDGTNWTSTTCGGGGSSTTFTAQTGNFTAASNAAYWINCASACTATLPASPSDNDWVILVNGIAVPASTATVGRNSKNIMGSAANMVIDTANFAIKLVYRSATTDWRIVD